MVAKLFYPFFILILLLLFSVGLDQKKILQTGESLKYGTYGLHRYDLPKKTDTTRIAFLGNSVFQGTPVLSELKKLEAAGRQKFEIFNLGMAGASIADYIITYNYIKSAEPDYLVVHFYHSTFGGSYSIFRNESFKMILHPRLWSALSLPEIRELYDRNMLAESLIYSYFPPYRYLHYLRYGVKTLGNNIMPISVMRIFPYSLNNAGDWQQNQALKLSLRSNGKSSETMQHIESKALFQAFLHQLQKDQQQAFFVFQEYNGKESMPLAEEVKTMVSDEPLFSFHDMRSFHNESDFGPGLGAIHPTHQGSQNVARRLYQVLSSQLRINGR